MASIAIIEDSSLVIDMLTMVCEDNGHTVRSYQRFDDAADALTDDPPELIVTDLNLPDLSGDNSVTQLRQLDGLADVPIVVISGRPREELEEIADDAGAQAALSKDDGMPAISSELPSLIDDLAG